MKKLITGIIALAVVVGFGYYLFVQFGFSLVTKNLDKEISTDTLNDMQATFDKAKQALIDGNSELADAAKQAEQEAAQAKQQTENQNPPKKPDSKPAQNSVSQKLKDIESQVAFADKARVMSILASTLSPSEISQIMALAEKSPSEAMKSGILTKLKDKLTTEQKKELLRYAFKYADLIEKAKANN